MSHNGAGAFELRVHTMSTEAICQYRSGVAEPMIRLFRIAAFLWETGEAQHEETAVALLEGVVDRAYPQLDLWELSPLVQPDLREVWEDLLVFTQIEHSELDPRRQDGSRPRRPAQKPS